MPNDELCECGKPLAHLHAPEDSKDWGCLIPDFDKQTGRPVKRHHTFRIDPLLWEAARDRAAERNETVTDVITRALEKYTK